VLEDQCNVVGGDPALLKKQFAFQMIEKGTVKHYLQCTVPFFSLSQPAPPSNQWPERGLSNPTSIKVGVFGTL